MQNSTKKELNGMETLTIKETAKILRVSENMLRQNIKQWGIPFIQNGNRKLILKEKFFREFLGYKGEIEI
jgi:excisionase family DNA binding protein